MGARPKQDLRSARGPWLGWWTGASFGLHGVFLIGILLLAVHTPVVHESTLRVRLLTEAPQLAAPAPPARPILRRIFSPRPLRLPPEEPRVPIASQAAPLLPPEAPTSGANTAPVLSPPSLPSSAGTPPEWSANSGGSQSQVKPTGHEGGDAARPAGEGPRPGGVGTGNVPAPELPRSESKVQGVVLMPDNGGTGTGRSGSGVSDPGAGGGVGPPGSSGVGAGGGGGSGPHVASRAHSGQGGGGSLADMLRAIRRRIEEAKIYPEAAQRAGMEGTVEVRFQIGPSGVPMDLEIVRSSGDPELDQASLETIRRAGPYPTIHGRLRIPIAYHLDR